MRVGAIDVGSNSTRLLVADIEENGTVIPVARELKTTRLGQGISGGVLLGEPVERTLAVIRHFNDIAERAGAQHVMVAATSAVRDARNKDEFASRVKLLTGRDLLVLSGEEEARLSYLGVTSGLELPGEIVVVDIGGGSTEFTWRYKDDIKCASVKAGAVRMTETGYGGGEIRFALKETLQAVARDGFDEVVAVGGTATTLAAIELGLRQYDPGKVHGYRLEFEAVVGLDEKLHALSLEERKRLPGLQPQRADIIPAGTRILRRVMQELHAGHVTVSEADILYGLVLEGRNVS